MNPQLRTSEWTLNLELEKRKDNLFSDAADGFDFGKPNTIRYNVLVWVVTQEYEKSLLTLSQYVEAGSTYPEFKEKSSRLVNHCVDLVHAIKAKRNFPGIRSLTYSRQKELSDKYKFHLRELQDTLIRIEGVYQSLRIKDVRSTVYVVKALWIAGASVLVAGFSLDLFHGLAGTSATVLFDLVDRFASMIFP